MKLPDLPHSTENSGEGQMAGRDRTESGRGRGRLLKGGKGVGWTREAHVRMGRIASCNKVTGPLCLSADDFRGSEAHFW